VQACARDYALPLLNLHILKTKLAQKIKEFSPHFKENTILRHYKDQLVNAVKEIISVYSENHTKPINMKDSVKTC
jgi:hypothetical protein